MSNAHIEKGQGAVNEWRDDEGATKRKGASEKFLALLDKGAFKPSPSLANSQPFSWSSLLAKNYWHVLRIRWSALVVQCMNLLPEWRILKVLHQKILKRVPLPVSQIYEQVPILGLSVITSSRFARDLRTFPSILKASLKGESLPTSPLQSS